jgi:hypothetical protein
MPRRSPFRRRDFARIILAVPALPALARAQGDGEPAKPSPTAEFIATGEPGLSPAEREALKKSIAGFEKSLQVVRDFKLASDVPPAFRFAALRSKGRT